jgi:hypothetical protein
MSPAAMLVARGVSAAALVAFFQMLGHDLAYRLREALEDADLVGGEEPRVGSSASSESRTNKGGNGRSHKAHGMEWEAQDGFGHRDAHAASYTPMTEEAKARAVLGVGGDASRHEIERAYRAQMKRAHPDHGGSVARAAALNAARDVLLRR